MSCGGRIQKVLFVSSFPTGRTLPLSVAPGDGQEGLLGREGRELSGVRKIFYVLMGCASVRCPQKVYLARGPFTVGKSHPNLSEKGRAAMCALEGLWIL